MRGGGGLAAIFGDGLAATMGGGDLAAAFGGCLAGTRGGGFTAADGGLAATFGGGFAAREGGFAATPGGGLAVAALLGLKRYRAARLVITKGSIGIMSLLIRGKCTITNYVAQLFSKKK